MGFVADPAPLAMALFYLCAGTAIVCVIADFFFPDRD